VARALATGDPLGGLAALDQLEPGVSTIENAVELLRPYATQGAAANEIRTCGWSDARSAR